MRHLDLSIGTSCSSAVVYVHIPTTSITVYLPAMCEIMEVDGNCLFENLSFLDYSTVVNLLIEEKLSPRYNKKNCYSTVPLYRHINLPIQGTVTLQKVSTVR